MNLMDQSGLLNQASGIFAQATAEHGPAIQELVNPEGLNYPKLAARISARSAKSVKFTSQLSQFDLLDAFFQLLAYGHWDRARQIAEHLAEIPKLVIGPYYPIICMLHGAYWYAVRQGDIATIESLKERYNEPSDYDCDLEGRILRSPLDEPKLRAQLGLDAVEGPYNDLLPPSYRPQYFTRELGQISFMWGRGGSERWPRDRLEGERQRLEAALMNLPGMQNSYE